MLWPRVALSPHLLESWGSRSPDIASPCMLEGEHVFDVVAIILAPFISTDTEISSIPDMI